MSQTIVKERTDGEKCPGCNYRVTNLYRLESESEDERVCGDCFTNWLINRNADVEFPDTN